MARHWALVFLLGAAGCGPPDVDYVLVYPSLETFLLSATAVVSVYDGAESAPEICRNLNVGQAPGVQPVATTGKQDVCLFESQASQVRLENIDAGRLVLFAEVADKAGSALMRGCRIADVAYDSEPVELTLATLPVYPEDPALSCASVQQKCEDLVSCDPR